MISCWPLESRTDGWTDIAYSNLFILYVCESLKLSLPDSEGDNSNVFRPPAHSGHSFLVVLSASWSCAKAMKRASEGRRGAAADAIKTIVVSVIASSCRQVISQEEAQKGYLNYTY